MHLALVLSSSCGPFVRCYKHVLGTGFCTASARHPSTGTSVSCDDVEKQSGLFPISTNVHHPKAKLRATLLVASFFAHAWPERRSSTVREPSPGAKSLEELRAPSHQVLSPPKSYALPNQRLTCTDRDRELRCNLHWRARTGAIERAAQTSDELRCAFIVIQVCHSSSSSSSEPDLLMNVAGGAALVDTTQDRLTSCCQAPVAKVPSSGWSSHTHINSIPAV